MYLNKAIYKANNECLKKFNVISDDNLVKTYFILSNFSGISVNEIVRLLNNDRNIIIDDKSVIEIDKLYEIIELLDDEEKINNLKISKEAIIKLWFHQEYADLLHELEIIDNNNSDNIAKADLLTNSAIKIKYLDNPEYLLKVLDSSIYLKKTFLSQFQEIEIDLKKEFSKLINFKHDVNHLFINSSNIYIEQLSLKQNILCNVVNIENNFYPQAPNIEKWGVISLLDFDSESICNFDIKDLSYLPYSLKKEFSSISWIDAVKVRKILKKQAISKVLIENLDQYSNLKEIKVCTEYGFNRERTKTIYEFDKNDNIVPLYSKFIGWNRQIDNLENEEQIPNELLIFGHSLKRILNIDLIRIKLKNFEIDI